MKVIVAGSRRQAENTATIDWGWQRGPQGFIDKSGETVRYVDRLEQLYGLERGSVTVFLGFEWYANRDLRGLLDLCAQREYKTVYDGNDEQAMKQEPR